jgi:hypothetical protein
MTVPCMKPLYKEHGMEDRHTHTANEPEHEQFGELLKFTVAGFVGGAILGGVLDHMGFQKSGAGQWAVRTLAGEGESILEGIYALRSRIMAKSASMAEAYGWGKMFGMAVPWIIDAASRLSGIDIYGIQGFYIAYFYAMSDQIGANLSGLLYIKRSAGTWSRAVHEYLRHPVMLTSLIIVFVVPCGLLAARFAGFSPTTQVLTAFETIAANLCWLPPLIGWLRER